MTLQSQTRRLSSCCRHPAEPVTGFCASCLRERLAGLEPSGLPEPSSSTAATPFKSILQSSGAGRPDRACRRNIAATSSSTLSPELRRSKSFSVKKLESGSSEPRRKSCDVRVPNTLMHLFNLDDERNAVNGKPEVESKNLGLSGLTGPVFEAVTEEENEEIIRVSELERDVDADEHIGGEAEEELMTMKEHIDLEWQSWRHAGRDLKDIAGSFWVAASVFSQKLRKWKRKQKVKKLGSGGNDRGLGGGDGLGAQVEKPKGRLLRETQSEVAEYGLGRRSCDTDPRFSVDGGRMSLDDPRFSFDEHRASWDGYLIARTIPRLTPMLSVVDNVMMAPLTRSDNWRLSEEQMMNSTSGGSAQNRDYYFDSSSSQRRSSFDSSSSVKSSKKKPLSLEVDEMKSILNSKVSPATIDIFHGTKLLVSGKEMDNVNSNSIKNDRLEGFESASRNATSGASGNKTDPVKKAGGWRKGWKIWGFLPGLGENKFQDVRGNVIDPPLAECCQKQADEVENGASGRKLIRSSSCVCSRSSGSMIGSYGSRRSVTGSKGCPKKNREESVLDRNWSARYSPSNFDNGLLRFYLTPLRSHRSRSEKSRLKKSHPIASNVLRLN